ncbi:PhzF family phenazine biosynthesis protein [Amycolatopsis sp. GM8]|uniref:PhzF family phenazine biosynthesis protein n=1 Tax=Amycolatopsis sp. GM8 TaxID=2896530 RepID=UPI001F164BE4|nr:PhzF family phenazine biosynthesis protein [Amycolatopsis sp. GM8]
MRLYIVDTFTDTAFAGNPAGVVLLDEPADPAWMQSVAAELKHAETAFVEVGGEGPKSLRWFTPTVEVDLCGHATLATGHVLGGAQVFMTRSGELRTSADAGWVRMDFPSDPPAAAPDEISLPGVTVKEVLRGKWDILVRAADAAEVRGLEPDLGAIAGWDARCVVVTAPGDRPGVDVVSRVFGPAVGVPEDPVTGSAHCMLSPYWSVELGRDELIGEQASARGGVVRMSLQGERVILAGQAVTTVRGELVV